MLKFLMGKNTSTEYFLNESYKRIPKNKTPSNSALGRWGVGEGDETNILIMNDI